MTLEERKKLIKESNDIEANLQTPAQMRRLNEIRSLLLTDGKAGDVQLTTDRPSSSFFSKRTMSGFTNRRRK